MDVITLPKETDEALMEENKIVDEMIGLKNKSREEITSEVQIKKKSSNLPLILIFIAFIVVAAAFIYFNSGIE